MRRLMRTLGTAIGFAGCGLLAGGCASVISERAYVQDAAVTAPAGHLPVHLAGESGPGHAVITPVISFGRKERVEGLVPQHSMVGTNGLYQVDTLRSGDGSIEFVPGRNPNSFTGSNFHWRTLPFVAGVGLDLPVSPVLSLSAGLCYASPGDGTEDLWGGHAGVGLSSMGPVLGMRLDLGVQWTPVAYSVASVVETRYEEFFSTKEYTRSTFYRDDGTGAPFGWYGGLTVNTVVPEWPVHPFVSLRLQRQRFFSYTPSHWDPLTTLVSSPEAHNATVETALTLMEVSPGLALSVGPSQRLLLGVRVAFVPGLGDQESTLPAATGPMLAPFVQVNLGL